LEKITFAKYSNQTNKQKGMGGQAVNEIKNLLDFFKKKTN